MSISRKIGKTSTLICVLICPRFISLAVITTSFRSTFLYLFRNPYSIVYIFAGDKENMMYFMQERSVVQEGRAGTDLSETNAPRFAASF